MLVKKNSSNVYVHNCNAYMLIFLLIFTEIQQVMLVSIVNFWELLCHNFYRADGLPITEY